jgi:hypothetical protein
MGMRTRVVATVTASLLAVFLMGVGPPAGAGQSQISDLQMTPNVNEGETAHLTGTINQQCPGSGESLTVGWGDGSTDDLTGLSSGPFDLTHTYADDNPPGQSDLLNVSLLLTDNCDHNPYQTGARTTVHNLDPVIEHFDVFHRGAGQFTPIEMTFTDEGTLDTFTVTIDWGDGSQNTVLLLPAIQKIREAHRYMAAGQFKVSVTVQDDDGGIAEDSITFDVALTQPRMVTGSGKGRPSLVKFFESGDKPVPPNFLAYRSSFTGGVRVAVGDWDGDGVADIITAPGAGGGPHVRVFSGDDHSLLDGFFAYRSSFTGGVFVAAGDVNGDGFSDIITGAGAGGGPHVKVFDGRDHGNLLGSFMAFRSSFNGGVRVATGDVNGDGYPDIIVGAGPGGGPHIKVFNGRSEVLMHSFYAFRSSFTGGVFVAGGDVNGDGLADIIVGADAGGGPLVNVFSVGDPAGGGGGLVKSFFAYRSSFTGGVRVAAADVNGDGRADIITAAGAGGGPHVKAFNSSVDGGTVFDFAPYDSSFLGGVYVGAGVSLPATGD